MFSIVADEWWYQLKLYLLNQTLLFWGNIKKSKDYSLSSSTSIRFSISEVLFWRRNSFCLAWHFGSCDAQSTWTLSLQIRHRRPCRVCPAKKKSGKFIQSYTWFSAKSYEKSSKIYAKFWKNIGVEHTPQNLGAYVAWCYLLVGVFLQIVMLVLVYTSRRCRWSISSVRASVEQHKIYNI